MLPKVCTHLHRVDCSGDLHLQQWPSIKGVQYIDDKLLKADKSVFLKLFATYRYRKIKILKLSKNYRYQKMHKIWSDKNMKHYSQTK